MPTRRRCGWVLLIQPTLFWAGRRVPSWWLREWEATESVATRALQMADGEANEITRQIVSGDYVVVQKVERWIVKKFRLNRNIGQKDVRSPDNDKGVCAKAYRAGQEIELDPNSPEAAWLLKHALVEEVS